MVRRRAHRSRQRERRRRSLDSASQESRRRAHRIFRLSDRPPRGLANTTYGCQPDRDGCSDNSRSDRTRAGRKPDSTVRQPLLVPTVKRLPLTHLT